mgnify:FL=1
MDTNLLKNCCLLVFTESWLSSNFSDQQIALANYEVFRADREGIKSGKTKAGGLTLYVNKDWCGSIKVVSCHCSPYLETMAVNLRPFWSPREISCITLLIVYAVIFESTSASVAKETTDAIHSQIDVLETKYPDSTVITLGDFNHVNLKLPNYKQQVTCTTRGHRTLDKCYIKHKNAFKCFKLTQLGNSDHHPVVLLPRYKPVSKSPSAKTTMVRDWSKSNSEKILCAIETTDWELFADIPDINKRVEHLTDYLNFCLNDCVPLIERQIRPDKAWMNGKIRSLLAHRHSALTNQQHHELPTIKANLQREIRRAKTAHASRVEKSFTTCSRQSWTDLKSLLKMTKTTSKCHLPPETLNTFYARFEKETTPPSLPPLSTNVAPQLTTEEVIKALCCVNIRKSTGPDNIPSRLLKLSAYALGEPLCKIFNDCITQGVFPDPWKMSTINPIPKVPGASEAKDFRPIALTPVISKVFERLIVKFFTPCLADKLQFAYQQHKSTEDALAYLLDVSTEHLDRSSKHYARCLFIDFTSAFNTISPTILVDQLITTNLNPALINLVYDFLTNRKQQVRTALGISPPLSTNIGSPQGCVLSPLLFSIYVQHMPKPPSDNFHLVKYADDAVFIELLFDNDTSSMSDAACALSGWCNDNDLILNVSKTKEMYITNQRFDPPCTPLKINDACVESVQSFKYLGTIIDSKLKFQLNTDYVIEKARKRIYIMKKLSSLHVAEGIRVQCYTTFIQSVFLFHLCTIFGHLSANSKSSYNKVIKLAGNLGNCTFDDILAIYNKAMKNRCLRIVAADHESIFTLDTLPSGRYRAVKSRVNIRSNCFRAKCVKFLNTIFH